MRLVALTLLASLAADSPESVSVSSPTAQLITVTLGGIAAIITAASLFANARRRRQAEADAIPVPAPADPESSIARIRERLTAVETRVGIHDRVLEDHGEQLQLHRAVDVVAEAEAAPRRRRRPAGAP